MKILKLLIIIFLLSQHICFSQSWNALWKRTGNTSYSVLCLKEINNILYVGGGFLPENGTPGKCIATFNGLQWDSLGCGLYDAPFSIEEFNDGKIYVGGNFYMCDTTSAVASKMLRWNGNHWEKFSQDDFDGQVNVIKYKNELYFGGIFSKVGSLPTKRIAKWDGSNWYDVGGGVSDVLPPSVECMTVYNNKLVVAGGFTLAGTTQANNIAFWDGSTWSPLGNGLNDIVFSLYTDTINNLLYAGGSFTMADTLSAKYIACWDGQKWISLRDSSNSMTGINSGTVTSITTFNNKLYVGSYAAYSPSTDTLLSCWNGTHWEKIYGPNEEVHALTVYKGNLYVGGAFNQVNGDTTIKYIACYGDSCPLNIGINEIKTDKTEYLWQNIPNPFDNSTTIPYYVPYGSIGFLQITDTKGELVDEYALQQGGNNLTISLQYLKSGTYFYSIVIDGIKKDTKKMILQ